MAAQAAVDYNSAALQSQLRQSQVATLKAKKPRGEVFDSASRRRIPFAGQPKTGSSPQTQSALTTPPTAANNNQNFRQEISAQERFEREKNFQAEMHQKKIEDQLRTQSYQIPDAANLMQEVPEENLSDFDPIMQDYDRRMAKLQKQDRSLSFTDTARNGINQAKQKLTDEAKQMVAEEAKKYIKKYGKDMVWRLIGRGGVVEAEGAVAWSWFGTGMLTSMYQTGKAALGQKDLLPGMLSWLEPNTLDSKNPLTWILDVPYAIVGFLIAVLLIGVIHVVIIIMVGIALGANSMITNFGSIISWIGSIF
ncbi:hypothetical protein KJ766_02010 [Patescibacteria group bacterium]|nr:hypothetical protein [Patescibacteria group bacterium]